MKRKSAIEETQRSLAQLAEQLLEIEDKLREILRSLPESERRDMMEEGRIPFDVPTDIRGALECVIDDDIRPAIRTLEDACTITDKRLSLEWRNRRPK